MSDREPPRKFRGWGFLGVLAVALCILVTAVLVRRNGGGSPGPNPEPHRTAEPQALSGPSVTPRNTPAISAIAGGDIAARERSDEAKSFWSRLITRHSARHRILKHFQASRFPTFSTQLSDGFLQARLLALCYPDEVEAAIFSILSNPQSDPREILFCAKTLGVLAGKGRTSSEMALVKLLDSTEPNLVAACLDALLSQDPDGRHRGLYWKKCSEGVFEAYEYGPFWNDGQTKQVLTQIFERNNTPESPAFYSREALDRMAILESAERSSLLDGLIGDVSQSPRPPNANMRQSWALRVVGMNPTPKTLELLRDRLTTSESRISRFYDGKFLPPGPTQPGYADDTGDTHFDLALLTYWRLGGNLNEAEHLRLEHYGYLGVPQERLKALMADVPQGGK